MTRIFLQAFVALIAIVNPLAAVPQFLILTDGPLRKQRRRVAILAGMSSTVILTVFLLAGTYIFTFFGITVPAFGVIGGTLFFMNALKVLLEDEQRIRTLKPLRGSGHASQPDAEDPEFEADPATVAIVPLSTPLLAGPGAITSVMVFVNLYPGLQGRMSVLLAIVVVGLLSTLTLLAAVPLSRFIGERFRVVFQKIMALLLGAIGVQLILNGILELVRG